MGDSDKEMLLMEELEAERHSFELTTSGHTPDPLLANLFVKSLEWKPMEVRLRKWLARIARL
jgi:hypothetical protein